MAVVLNGNSVLQKRPSRYVIIVDVVEADGARLGRYPENLGRDSLQKSKALALSLELHTRSIWTSHLASELGKPSPKAKSNNSIRCSQSVLN